MLSTYHGVLSLMHSRGLHTCFLFGHPGMIVFLLRTFKGFYLDMIVGGNCADSMYIRARRSYLVALWALHGVKEKWEWLAKCSCICR